jgi:hypothetical protein
MRRKESHQAQAAEQRLRVIDELATSRAALGLKGSSDRAGARVIYGTPPGGGGMHVIEENRLTEARGGDAQTVYLGEQLNALHGLGPGMEGEVEGAVVDGNEPSTAEILVGADGLFGQHVDLGPAIVVGAVFEEVDGEGTVLTADLAEAGEVAGVGSVEDAEAVGRR